MYIDKGQDKLKEHFKYGINQWTGEPNKPVFYTEEMKKKVHQIKKPSLLLMDVVIHLLTLSCDQFDPGCKVSKM